jgi:hypothetical protein
VPDLDVEPVCATPAGDISRLIEGGQVVTYGIRTDRYALVSIGVVLGDSFGRDNGSPEDLSPGLSTPIHVLLGNVLDDPEELP